MFVFFCLKNIAVRVRVERLVWIDIYTLKSMGLYTGEKRSLQRRGFGVVLGRGIS